MRIEVLSWGRKCLVYLRFSCNLCPFFRSFTLSLVLVRVRALCRVSHATQMTIDRRKRRRALCWVLTPQTLPVYLCVWERKRNRQRRKLKGLSEIGSGGASSFHWSFRRRIIRRRRSLDHYRHREFSIIHFTAIGRINSAILNIQSTLPRPSHHHPSNLLHPSPNLPPIIPE